MNLLLTGCFNYSEENKRILNSLGYTIYFMQQENQELPLPASDIDAIVCNGLFLYHDIDLFKRLKLIQLTSAGYDRVPIEKIKAQNIEIYNAKGVYSIPMAEWTLFKVLEYYKQGRFFNNEQSKKKWTKNRDLREVNGKKVAIIGAGNVGQEIAKRFQAFGAETTGFDIHTNSISGFNHMLLTKTLKEHVNEFDIIVVTAPLLPSTKGLISKDIVLAMKLNAILINVARGGLIDEQGLCEVLEKRKDLFAALDVFQTEPLNEESPLWKLNNVAISPHNSFVSERNNNRMFDVIRNNLKDFINKQ